uniref:Uncharacterized protein n=1 Tax=Parascaris univalens TaxID=6257 RepID=A0A915C865_PARUN
MTVERRVGNEKIVELLEGVSRSQIIKQLRPVGDASSAQMNGGSDNVVASFKELIKRQDETIATLNHQIKNLTATWLHRKRFVKTLNEGIEAERELAKLKQEMAERCQIENDRKQAEQPHIEHFRSASLPAVAEQWQQYQIAQLPNAEEVVVQQLSAQVKQLEEQLTYGWQSFEVQGASLAQTSAQLVEANRKIHDLEVQLAAAMSNAATVEGARSQIRDELRKQALRMLDAMLRFLDFITLDAVACYTV